MLSFATEFPISSSVSTNDFLGAVIAWIVGSPHTVFRPDDLGDLVNQSDFSTKKSNEQVHSLCVPTSDNSGLAAFRHTRLDKGIEWETTIAFSGGSPSGWIGVRVNCESQHPSVRLPAAKKPVVVRTLLEAFGGGADGELLVSPKPIRLSNSEVPFAARCILGETGTRLPIVYVSIGFHGGHAIDAALLADKLAGMAHVLVEPNRQFSLRLMQEVGGENVYGGAVGIYWPDGAGRRTFFIGRQFESAPELQDSVLEEIRQALVNRRPLGRTTWANVQEFSSREKISALRRAGSTELNEYVSQFDREIAAARQNLVDAEQEIGRLRADIRRYQARGTTQSGIVLHGIAEQDLYEGEIQGIIRDAIEEARSRVQPESRRQHVLESIAAANPPTGQADAFRSRLKEILRNYRNMESRTREDLVDLGFEISEEGKHFKLVYQGDDRYVFSLPKTGSDHRGGLNAASDIGKRIF